jgi:hypothetical protein
MITWRTVESSNVSQVGWTSDADRMVGNPPTGFIRYKNGQAYAYHGLTRQRLVYMATSCASVGAYVNKVVKTKYPSLRVPHLDADRPPF